MRIAKYIGILVVGVSAIGTTAVMAKRVEPKQKKKSEGFAEKAKQLKEQQEKKQQLQGVLSNQQEQDLKQLINDYKSAKSAKDKVRIGSQLVPVAERYLTELTQQGVLSSLLRDKQEMQLVGELATVVGDLKQNMEKASSGIFTQIKQEVKKLADKLLVEETYE